MRAIGAVLLLAAMGVPEARADDDRPAPPSDFQVRDPSLVIGEILVVGRRDRESAASVLTSVDRLGADIIERQNVDNAWQLLGRPPGVTLTSFNQGTTSGKFSFRGFNGEGEINAVKLLIDGIPSNTNDGNMPFIDMLFPLDIASIETVRGTSDPRWGLHNIAGNASVRTRTGGEGVAARLGYGSHQILDMQAAGGLRLGAFTQDYLVGYRRSNGFRAHSDYDRLALAGKWFYAPAGGDVRLGAIARHYRSEAEEPGYLSEADARADPRQSYAISRSDGGERRIGQYSLHAEADLARGLDASLRGYLNTFDDRRFIRFSAGVSQQERYADEQQRGVTWHVKWRPEFVGLHNLTLETGGDHQAQSNHSLRWNTAERVRTRQTRDQDFDLDVTGAYIQAVIEPTRWLKLVPAFRVDWVGGSFADRLTGQSYPVNDYGAIEQPKINVAVEPLGGLTLYGNWGRTFQIGVGARAPTRCRRASPISPPRSTRAGRRGPNTPPGASWRRGWLIGSRVPPAKCGASSTIPPATMTISAPRAAAGSTFRSPRAPPPGSRPGAASAGRRARSPSPIRPAPRASASRSITCPRSSPRRASRGSPPSAGACRYGAPRRAAIISKRPTAPRVTATMCSSTSS
ncbi:TonB-dependent receptor [Sphingomonas psychrotolerans]|uniref:TonB-dependent receptor n=1 Tax=Sphingomonas psychrotolerans TaxID=1327635 RepID=A0A2K8MQ22_9SPHN|nr:TonB-dependent receptor [Sphingomonas psychrotolerans]